jgi:hypothetical protein
LSCALCETRKEKRFCPAVHGRICPQCCGEQREVTLDCPSDCVYLQQARAHEKPRALAELDREALFPEVEVDQSFLYQREHLLMGLSFALARSAHANRELNDGDLIAALSAFGRNLETLVNSGLHYEKPGTNPAHQAVIAELQKMLTEFREVEQKNLGYATLRDSEILKAIVFLVRLAYTRTSGRPRSRAYVDFLLAQFPEKSSGVVAPQEAASRIIVP